MAFAVAAAGGQVMSDQLFRDVAAPSVRIGSRSWTTVPLSIAAHAVMLGVLVVVPLMATGALPSPQSVMLYVAPPIIPPPPDLPRPSTPPPTSPQPVSVPNPAAAPTQEATQIRDEPAQPPNYTLTASGRGVPTPWTGLPIGTGMTPTFTAPPPAVTKPLPIGGNIKEPAKIHHVTPVYPAIAQSAKIAGIVIIEATIGRDGTVIETRVLRSVPLLDKAALDAVRQWRFTPTLLNGVPVPIVMTVTVNFELR
jgi:protein TonB